LERKQSAPEQGVTISCFTACDTNPSVAVQAEIMVELDIWLCGLSALKTMVINLMFNTGRLPPHKIMQNAKR
jgi:hypothetical protein